MDIKTLSRKIAAEGMVLLKNENDVLPLEKGTRVALFGRMQTTYYKSGTGSGGLVHLEKEPCITEALENNHDIILDKELKDVYESWIIEHPFNDGGGVWAGEPWYQEEMPVSMELAKACAERNQVAVVVIGRTAGEDHDNADEMGSYRLTETEEKLLENVSLSFEKVVVALNVGNIIDLSFLDRYNVSSLLYIWQGGMEGHNAFADVLTGKSYPCGKLPDTQAYNISDYPSHKNFGDEEKNVYEEDIYVGYRYFETFAKDKVRYPFGFGLSYTTFDMEGKAIIDNKRVCVSVKVKNTGKRAGREVVQVYFKAPCGVLGTPAVSLVAFAKTKELDAGESQTVELSFGVDKMASYDDSGITGHKSCYVLQKGEYEIYVGNSVRNIRLAGTYAEKETVLVEKLEEAMAPSFSFDRLVAKEEAGVRIPSVGKAPSSTVDEDKRIEERRMKDIPYTGDRGIKLVNVKEGKNTIEEFVAQLTDSQIASLVCGEGMCSSKATPGTGGACGGQDEGLQYFGIPVCAVTDGPSGIRLDTGEKASLIPNGTLLASTWDVCAVEEIYGYISEELKLNCVDALLGPGINIHRHPLCGRNFEYFSEDPLLSGKIASSATRGISKCGCFATIKHFACNNQEKKRHSCESVVSERALREIYLKPFEIAVKEGKNVLIMTSYNPVNGFWSASNYDLTTTILRKEWGFDNFVMTDWWAKCNLKRGGEGDENTIRAMVRAQNDVYMVCENAIEKSEDVLSGIKEGYITRGQVQRCVLNILGWIIRTNTFAEYVENGSVPKYPVSFDESNMTEIFALHNVQPDVTYELNGGKPKEKAVLTFTVSSDAQALAQNVVTVNFDSEKLTLSVPGTEGRDVEFKRLVWVNDAETHTFSVEHNEHVKVKHVLAKQK